jgi:CheY-like chemotaxis protein
MSYKKTILLVDDSRTTRSYVSDILSKAGYEIQEAENGIKALLSISRNMPDAMVLDLLMPEMDGFEVLETLQQQKIKLPIIVVTADVQEEVHKECMELGASAFLNKPVAKDVLLETLKKIMQ